MFLLHDFCGKSLQRVHMSPALICNIMPYIGLISLLSFRLSPKSQIYTSLC